MRGRFCLGVLLFAGLLLPLVSCNNTTGLDSIQVTPATNTMVLGGATLQLTATGKYGNAAHASTQNITTGVTWTSASTGIAQVGASTGLVTAEGNGTTTITATAMGFNGLAPAAQPLR